MKQVKGYPEWWNVEYFPQIGSVRYQHWKNGKRSDVFICKEEKLYRRGSTGMKYTVYIAGAGPNHCAKEICGKSTLVDAIKEANTLMGEI